MRKKMQQIVPVIRDALLASGSRVLWVSQGRSKGGFSIIDKFKATPRIDLALSNASQCFNELEPFISPVAGLDLVKPFHYEFHKCLYCTLELTMFLAE